MIKTKALLAAGAIGLGLSGAANATSIDITFNNSNGFGFLVTPVYTGLHSGTFDAFDEGGTASAGVEQVAEVPIPPFPPNLIAPERLAVEPDSQGGFIFGPGGPIMDGESGTLTIDVVQPTLNRYATFLSMFVPSNDTFFGNDDPKAYELFDTSGNVIKQTIEITAQSIWDAGTEVNRFFGSTEDPGVPDDPATPEDESIPGITLGEDENGTITRLLDIVGGAGGDADGFDDLADLFGLTSAGSITADTVLFTIDVNATPIPLPAGGALLLTGLGAFGFAARRRAKKS